MNQLSFLLHQLPDFIDEDFIIAEANHAAISILQQWPPASISSPLMRYQLLYGPQGSGKTHMATLWQKRHQAEWITPLQLASAFPEEILSPHDCFILEDIDRQILNENTLFHLLNAVTEQRKFLLLTSRIPASQMQIALPDLRSRLNALPSVGIAAPDDTLLETILLKHFSDRQLRVSHGVLQFLLTRVDRSFASFQEIVSFLDEKALTARKNITIPFIKALWEEWERQRSL